MRNISSDDIETIGISYHNMLVFHSSQLTKLISFYYSLLRPPLCSTAPSGDLNPLTDFSIVASLSCFRVVCNGDHELGESLFQRESQKAITSADESAVVRCRG